MILVFKPMPIQSSRVINCMEKLQLILDHFFLPQPLTLQYRSWLLLLASYNLPTKRNLHLLNVAHQTTCCFTLAIIVSFIPLV